MNDLIFGFLDNWSGWFRQLVGWSYWYGGVVGWFCVVGLVVDSFGGWIVGWLDGWLVWWLDCNSKLETEIGEAGLGSYDAGNRHPLVSQTFRLNLT